MYAYILWKEPCVGSAHRLLLKKCVAVCVAICVAVCVAVCVAIRVAIRVAVLTGCCCRKRERARVGETA